MSEVDQRYLESLVKPPLVHLEALNGHRTSLVLSAVHTREPTVMISFPDAYEFRSNEIRSRYNLACFAYFGKKP